MGPTESMKAFGKRFGTIELSALGTEGSFLVPSYPVDTFLMGVLGSG